MNAVPPFSRPAAPGRRSRRLEWLAATTLLLGFVVRASVAARDSLARDASSRPWVMAVCDLLGCELPAWREPATLVMLQRDVHPLAGAPGVLQIQATFRNDARWPQAWPVLYLRLSDAEGRTTGEHGFAPTDYLAPEQAGGVLAPGQSAQVAFQVREPATGTAAFSFEFR